MNSSAIPALTSIMQQLSLQDCSGLQPKAGKYQRAKAQSPFLAITPPRHFKVDMAHHKTATHQTAYTCKAIQMSAQLSNHEHCATLNCLWQVTRDNIAALQVLTHANEGRMHVPGAINAFIKIVNDDLAESAYCYQAALLQNPSRPSISSLHSVIHQARGPVTPMSVSEQS